MLINSQLQREWCASKCWVKNLFTKKYIYCRKNIFIGQWVKFMLEHTLIKIQGVLIWVITCLNGPTKNLCCVFTYVCNKSKSVRIMLCECMVLQGPTVPRLLVSTLFWWENWIEKKYRNSIEYNKEFGSWFSTFSRNTFYYLEIISYHIICNQF